MKILKNNEVKKFNNEIFLITEKETIVKNKIISIEICDLNYNRDYQILKFSVKFYLDTSYATSRSEFCFLFKEQKDYKDLKKYKHEIYLILIYTLKNIKEEVFEEVFIENVKNKIK